MTAAHLVPNRQELGSRVHLEILGRTEPGDVFYLVSDPATVYMRSPCEPRWTDDHLFIAITGDAWRKMEHVGDGRPEQLAVVLHNTRVKKEESLAGGAQPR